MLLIEPFLGAISLVLSKPVPSQRPPVEALGTFPYWRSKFMIIKGTTWGTHAKLIEGKECRPRHLCCLSCQLARKLLVRILVIRFVPTRLGHRVGPCAQGVVCRLSSVVLIPVS